MSYILFFDTETTGLPKNSKIVASAQKGNWPDLVSISWIVFKNKTFLKKETHIIKPDGWTIPDESIKFHTITNEQANLQGKPLLDVITKFKADMDNCFCVVAHNMNFDKNVILNACKWRLEDYMPFWENKLDFCTMIKSKKELLLPSVNQYKSDPYKFPGLDELYRDTFKKEPPSGAHSADRDVEVLQQIVWSRWPQLVTVYPKY